MNNLLISVIFAAGAATLVYSQLGKRVGYGNQQSVWSLVAITFGIVFVMALILLNTVVSL